MTIVLSSSDARPQYARDVLTVLAAPTGIAVQFRYAKTYVAPDLTASLSRDEVVGSTAVVAFVGEVATDRAYVLPVRRVRIVEATDEGDAFIIRFVVQDYVDLRHWPLDRAAITDRGRGILQAVYTRYPQPPVAAWGDHGQLPDTAAGTDTNAWQQIADRLAKLEPFAQSYLARMRVTTAKDKARTIDDGGSVEIRYRRTFVVHCYYTSASEPAQDHTVQVTADDKMFDFPTATQRVIRSPYDKVEFALYAKPMTQRYERDVVVEISGASEQDHDVPTRVEIPVTAYRPVLPRLIQWAVSAGGAGLVAIPALLGPGAQLEHKLIFAAVGAAVVATVTVFGDVLTGTRS